MEIKIDGNKTYDESLAINQSINGIVLNIFDEILTTHPLEYVNSDANAHHLVGK